MNDSNGSRLKVGVSAEQRAWLMRQPGGASRTIRELVDAARGGSFAPSVVRAVLLAALESTRLVRPELLIRVEAADLEQNSPMMMWIVEAVCERLHDRALPHSSATVTQAYAAENIRLRGVIASAAAASDNGGGSAGDAIQDLQHVLDTGAADLSSVMVDRLHSLLGPFVARFDQRVIDDARAIMAGGTAKEASTLCPKCGRADVTKVVALGEATTEHMVEHGSMAGTVERRAAKIRPGTVGHLSGDVCVLDDVRPILKAAMEALARRGPDDG